MDCSWYLTYVDQTAKHMKMVVRLAWLSYEVQLRGSASIAQLSDMVIGLERDQQHSDQRVSNTTSVRVLKNRFAGLTGLACYLYYDGDTGRMIETTCPVNDDNQEF